MHQLCKAEQTPKTAARNKTAVRKEIPSKLPIFGRRTLRIHPKVSTSFSLLFPIILTSFVRFNQAAVNNRLSLEAFRDSMGIIGIESLSFMCDRMYKAMLRESGENEVHLGAYLKYIDIMMYGSEE